MERTRGLAKRREVDRYLPGEEGIWVFISAEMTVFAVFFSTYMYYRSLNPQLFNESQKALEQGYGAINTMLLLTSSLFVIVGIQAIRRHAHRIAPVCFAAAIVCGLGFSVMKVLEYDEHIGRGEYPSSNEFFMYYFGMTGLHWLHVVAGMVVLTYLLVKSRAPELTSRQFGYVEGGACFWHMVDLLWIVIFPLLYFLK